MTPEVAKPQNAWGESGSVAKVLSCGLESQARCAMVLRGEETNSMKSALTALAGTLALAACADATPVMDAGNGTYFISAAAAPIRGGTMGAHSVAMSDAQKFCAQKGLRPVLVDSQERDVYQGGIGGSWTGGSGGFGGTVAAAGTVNMRFRCA